MEEQKQTQTIPLYCTKEYVKNYNKQYYEKNRERILKMQYAKTQCEYCEKVVAKFYMTNHMKTIKCMKMREKKEIEINETKVQELEKRLFNLENSIKLKIN